MRPYRYIEGSYFAYTEVRESSDLPGHLVQREVWCSPRGDNRVIITEPLADLVILPREPATPDDNRIPRAIIHRWNGRR